MADDLKTRRKRRLAREAYWDAKEAKVQASFLRVRRGPDENFLRHISNWSEERQKTAMVLFRYAVKKRPKLGDPRHWWPFTNLASVEDLDLSRLETWKPKGKSPETQIQSLIEHMVCDYPVPKFLLRSFDQAERLEEIRLFTYLARGGSLKKAIKEGLFPAKMTAKMCHFFMTMRSNRLRTSEPVYEAARRAQVQALGGGPRIEEAIATATALMIGGNQDFWFSVIQWFCNQPMFDPRQIGPVMDYLRHRKELNPDLTMKGRTTGALLQGMEEWHQELARVNAQDMATHGEHYKPSGLEEGIWEEKAGKSKVTWTMTEILTSKQLAAEGRYLKHCVYSYGRSIAEGRTSIWSLRWEDQRMLTVEVVNSKEIVQYRGKCNRKPTQVEMRILGNWAMENGLDIRTQW